MANQCTKFEVSVFTHYEDMKGNAKCRDWVVLEVIVYPRSPAMSPFDRAHATSYLTLIETMHLIPFSSYSKLFVKNRQF